MELNMTYYNTNNEEGTTLSRSIQQAGNQSEIILNIFEDDPTVEWTPNDVFDLLQHCTDLNWPITSIRRAITNLTSEGKLTKTSNFKQGSYGKKTHTWKLV